MATNENYFFKPDPIPAVRSNRQNEVRVLTSGDAGKVIPLSMIPILREDAVTRGQMRVQIDMMETVDTLVNAIHVNCYAHFVPFLAFDRFSGMDALNRSYNKVKEREADAGPVEFFPTAEKGAHGAEALYKTLGLHAPVGADVNLAYAEAYNEVINFRRKMRSASLPLRDKWDVTLAEAFWHHSHMRHIVPDFDQARIDGEVALNVVDGLLQVDGYGLASTAGASTAIVNAKMAGGVTCNIQGWFSKDTSAAGGQALPVIEEDPANPGFAGIFAELQQNGITVSLSNIELAKKTAAFARLREQYQGHDDEWLIDMLMSGVRIPEVAMKQPILLAHGHSIFGFNRRWATDFDNMEKSLTNGQSIVDLSFRTPPLNTGGVIVITAEVVPEQLFERQKDHFFFTSDPATLPEFLRDYLDPEKVEMVGNDHVDVLHSTPDGLFGYAPLNYKWQRTAPNVGGKFYRPTSDTFVEDRQRIWLAETANPALTADFYLVPEAGIQKKIFADTAVDSFEFLAVGGAMISGLTVFGAGLVEATDDYEKVAEKVDTTRIDLEATTVE